MEAKQDESKVKEEDKHKRVSADENVKRERHRSDESETRM